MRAMPTSLSGRLLLAAAIGTATALVIAGVLTWIVLDGFVHRQVDLALDNEILSIASVLSPAPGGGLQLSKSIDTPPFQKLRSGWYWQVTSGQNRLHSASLDGASLDLPEGFEPPPPRPGATPPPAPFDGPGPMGLPLHMRVLTVEVPGGGAARIIASAPASALSAPVMEAMTGVLIALGITAVILTLTLLLQIRLGLRPLGRLRAEVAEVRSGRRRSLPEAQPDELLPLVRELNKLIVENDEGLARARRHVANLAHGLKTPLASLSLALERSRGNPAEPDLQALVAVMDRRIRHHLGRARAAALSGGSRSRSSLMPRLRDLIGVMEKIHHARAVSLALAGPESLEVACEAQDLDEMLGNLLDNAVRFARSAVRVKVAEDGAQVEITIEDDGPGFAAGGLPEALKPGVRLDEGSAGYGFGLPIARELAELYGGTLGIGPSALGGALVRVRLPRAV